MSRIHGYSNIESDLDLISTRVDKPNTMIWYDFGFMGHNVWSALYVDIEAFEGELLIFDRSPREEGTEKYFITPDSIYNVINNTSENDIIKKDIEIWLEDEIYNKTDDALLIEWECHSIVSKTIVEEEIVKHMAQDCYLFDSVVLIKFDFKLHNDGTEL